MAELAERDFFTDLAIAEDPIPYFTELRAKSPVHREPHRGVMMVTGYDEALQVWSQPDKFSSCISIMGPMSPVSFEVKGDDISAEIREHHHLVPWATHFITFDQPEHMAHRTMLTRLLTYKRLKQNELYMIGLADRLIDKFIASGKCELVNDYAQTLATLVICDLLGVPEADRDELCETIGPPPGMVGDPDHKAAPDPLEYLDGRFTSYMAELRRAPQDNMMSELANSKFPDGSIPKLEELVRIATFLFVAGQDTSAKLITSIFKILGERPDLQALLRADRSKIPEFIEEALRFESPTKVNFRMTSTSTRVGDVEVPAGTVLTLGLGAINRDPARFDNPDEFQLGRAHVRDQIAFGRGPHACPGAPLARLEARVTLERFLDRLDNIRISEAEHGPPGARRYDYEATFILNGLNILHLEFDAR